MADVERRLVAIFAADVEGYSRLMGRDEVATLRDLTERRQILDGLIASHRGRIANTAGDSVLAEFASAVDAVQCAVQAQAAWAEANDRVPPDRRVKFRIGVHVGDVMVRAGDLFGDASPRACSRARRRMASAFPARHEQVRKILPLTFVDQGMQHLKNIEPIRAYAVSVAAEPSQAVRLRMRRRRWRSRQTLHCCSAIPNMSGDPEQDYFADGMVEESYRAVAFPTAFVIARNSSFTTGARRRREAGRARAWGTLRAEGSVRKAANRVRITGSWSMPPRGTSLGRTV
jgi:adenylate cyclase